MKHTLLRDTIKALARDAGYDDCGIMPARPFQRYEKLLRERMQRFPEAAPLYESMLHRTDPTATAPWVRSIVVCVHWYGKYRIPGDLDRYIGRHYLFDRRYRDCPDFAIPQKMKAGLRDLGLRVKRGGVPERWAAVLAGVAGFGRNNFVYSRRGSWITIESFRIDAPLEPDEPALDIDCPEGCTACRDACPSGAITGPFSMRMDRCIAWLSYEAPHPIDPLLWERMGPWIYGCDACQRACPRNRGTWRENRPCEWLERLAPFLHPEALADMDEKTFRETVHPAFWYIPPGDAWRWRANARRALDYLEKNSGPGRETA